MSPLPVYKLPSNPSSPTTNIRLCLFKAKFSNMDCEGDNLKLELKLNLSPPQDSRYAASTDISPRSSCVSCEASPDRSLGSGSVMLVGCPRCLMYVMLFEDDPKCPKCKSTVLLEFLHEERNTTRGNK